MIFQKTNGRRPNIAPSRSQTLPNPLVGEVIRLLWLVLAISLFLSLVSYSPSDPSWSTWSSRNQFHNWMGRTGSILADLMLQLVGVTSYVVAFVLGLFAFKRTSESATPSLRGVLSVSLFFVALSTLVQTAIPKGWLPWHLKNPGGVAGSLLAEGLTYLAGPGGAVLIALFLFLASGILVFRWQLMTTAALLSREFLPKAKESALDLVKQSALRVWTKISRLFVWRKKAEASPPIQMSHQATASLPAQSPVALLGSLDIEGTLASQIAPVIEAVKEIFPISSDKEEDADLKRMNSAAKTAKPAQPKSGKFWKQKKEAYELPALSLLSGKAESKAKTVDKNWYVEKASILVQKLKDFGVEGEVVNISPGPVITVYEFKPASGVKIKEISNLSDDLTLALSVLSVRIVAPIPGKPVVGIEIPSPHRETVFFKDMIQETPFFSGDIRIPIVLGRLASGEPVAADLASMPHLLVAGTTGTGKSVFINALISSLIYRFTPHQLKLILVDPKMVELSHYEGIPHLLLPVVVDSKKAVLALRWAVDEMERRYTKMHQFSVRHVDAYNQRLAEMKPEEVGEEHQFLPYMVVVIDEYADLMAVVPKDVELSIARLAQKARASGIHLVLATQRPSTDVVTGTIKANFPSRISFRVASSVDSKTILDRTGADRLLGNGDMLFHSAGFSSLKRMQGAFISDADTARVVEFLKSQGEPEYDERILQSIENAEQDIDLGGSGDEGEDSGRLYDAAVRLVADKGEASISLIQRHLKIGYNRAASLMEELEKNGVVAQATSSSKRRQVLINSL